MPLSWQPSFIAPKGRRSNLLSPVGEPALNLRSPAKGGGGGGNFPQAVAAPDRAGENLGPHRRARIPLPGVLLRSGSKGAEASILFSGDTGAPRQEELRAGEKGNEDLYAKGEKDLLAAVDEADIVIAHLSAVPLKELRMLSSLGSGSDGSVRANEYRELWEEAAALATSTHRDVQGPTVHISFSAAFLYAQESAANEHVLTISRPPTHWDRTQEVGGSSSPSSAPHRIPCLGPAVEVRGASDRRGLGRVPRGGLWVDWVRRGAVGAID